MLLIIIIGLALLKYFFDWSIFDAASSEQGRGTISYIRDILSKTWYYIGTPVMYVWNEILKPFMVFFRNSLGGMLEGKSVSGQ